jgi:GTP cyclohydrolase I
MAGACSGAALAVPSRPLRPPSTAMSPPDPAVPPPRLLRTEDELRRLPASERIRYRLVTADRRYHANDNIADFLREGEVEELKAEVQAKMEEVLRALVIDTDSDHNTNDTAKRVAKMYIDEVFSGRYRRMPSVTEFPNAERLNELMIVGPITVRSACSHHMCPIFGKVWIGILPNEHSNLIGLSKYARIADWIMSRPQIQEEAVTMLANELQERVRPDGLAIVMEADHFCMHWRGVKDTDSAMVNSVMRGAFLKDASLRREFLSLLPRKVN